MARMQRNQAVVIGILPVVVVAIAAFLILGGGGQEPEPSASPVVAIYARSPASMPASPSID